MKLIQDPPYDLVDAVTFSATVQLIVCVLSGLVLDCGRLNMVVVYSTAFFWACAGGVLCMRSLRAKRPLSAGDYVLLNDLLQYEITPTFDRWEGITTAIISRIQAQSKG